MRLPVPRGPVSRYLVEHLVRVPHELAAPSALDDPLSGNDTHLALYLIYELHYRGIEAVDDRWEWEPSLVACRRALEQRILGLTCTNAGSQGHEDRSCYHSVAGDHG